MIEYNATDWFYNDIERLRRYSPDWAESVYDLLDYYLLENSKVFSSMWLLDYSDSLGLPDTREITQWD